MLLLNRWEQLITKGMVSTLTSTILHTDIVYRVHTMYVPFLFIFNKLLDTPYILLYNYNCNKRMKKLLIKIGGNQKRGEYKC